MLETICRHLENSTSTMHRNPSAHTAWAGAQSFGFFPKIVMECINAA